MGGYDLEIAFDNPSIWIANGAINTYDEIIETIVDDSQQYILFNLHLQQWKIEWMTLNLNWVPSELTQCMFS